MRLQHEEVVSKRHGDETHDDKIKSEERKRRREQFEREKSTEARIDNLIE